MKSYFEILRPLNCTMAAVAVIIGVSIVTKDFLNIYTFMGAVVAFLVCGAGNIINDYYDRDIDKINNPNRPIPSGRINPTAARNMAITLFISGIFLSIFINNIYALILATFNSALLYAYGWKIKKNGGITKNLTVSYLVASPFLFGGVVGNDPTITLLLVILAGLANTSREILKDIEDIKGDQGIAMTLPQSIGMEKANLFATIILLMGVLISPLPFIFGMLKISYLYIVSIADLLFIYSIFISRKISTSTAGKAQRIIKLGMIFGMASFFIGRF